MGRIPFLVMTFHDIAIFVAFIAIVIGLLYWDRKKIVFSGVMFIRRTSKGKRFLDSTSKEHPLFWKIFGIGSLVVAIPAMIFISWFIINNVIQILQGQLAGAVSIVLPYTSFESRPGVLLVPWYFWVLGIASVVVPHEFSHGIMCRLHKIKVDSLGWFLLVAIPGAFVEPNKRSLKKAKRFHKLQVYAAGSFANILAAFFFAFLGFLMVTFLFTQVGITPIAVIEGTPAAAANLNGTLMAINGNPVTSIETLQNVLADIPPGSLVIVRTTTGNFSLITGENPERPGVSYLGVAGPYQPLYESKIPGTQDIANFIFLLLSWLFTINLGIGMFNLLPIKPLDGGLLFEEIVSRFTTHTRPITLAVSVGMGILVLFAIVGPALLGG